MSAEEYDPRFFPDPVPDHLSLPRLEGTALKTLPEHLQSVLLTECVEPALRRRNYGDGQFYVGQDSGIYYAMTARLEDGMVRPDWFLVGWVPPTLDGETRLSYVRWIEGVCPDVILEFTRGDGAEERDRTPYRGKFWRYDRALRTGYYGIHDLDSGRLEVFIQVPGTMDPLTPNERGHFPVRKLGLELGVWEGEYHHVRRPWLRWWDDQGRLLPTAQER